MFDRLPKGLALTPAGERYLADLGPAWDAVPAATDAARASERRKAFKVSVIPTFAANWLVPRLARDHVALAGLEIELETAPDIIDLMERRDLDCAIRQGILLVGATKSGVASDRFCRRLIDRTQVSVARRLGVKQVNISRLEGREDLRLSTLNKYIDAIGGRLHLIVEFPEQEPVLLSGIGRGRPKLKKKAA